MSAHKLKSPNHRRKPSLADSGHGSHSDEVEIIELLEETTPPPSPPASVNTPKGVVDFHHQNQLQHQAGKSIFFIDLFHDFSVFSFVTAETVQYIDSNYEINIFLEILFNFTNLF